MDREALLDRVATELFGYLMDGELSRDDLAAAIRPDSLDATFDEYEALVDLHFVLSDPVVSFVERLPERLRQLNTETERDRRVTRGEIRGRIEWSDTYQHRLAGGGTDGAVYVCSRREETRDTAENRLLGYVVERIADALGTAEPYLDGDAAWVEATWEGDPNLRDRFVRLRETNVHLGAIDVPDRREITDRMVRAAATARQPLYRRAAELYRRHREFRRGDEAALRRLLADTTVLPSDEADLFELYVLFETIRALESVAGTDALPGRTVGSHTLHTLVPGRSGPAAAFDGDPGFDVFYDQSGASLDLSFRVDPEAPPGEFSRGDAAAVYGDRAARELFGGSGGPNTKRPDVLLAPERPGEDPTAEYLVVEVKHSTRESTIKDGVRELTRYLAYMRRDGEPVFDRRGYQGSGINGLLVVGDVGEEIPSPDEQAHLPVTVVGASDLPIVLPDLLVELLSR